MTEQSSSSSSSSSRRQSSASSSIETNRQNFNIDWRTQKPSFDEQLEHFCLNEGMTDVEFVFNRGRGGKITVCLFR